MITRTSRRQRRNVARWIKDLKSGEYLQGEGYLCKISEGQHRFCCLGILSEEHDLWRKDGNEYVTASGAVDSWYQTPSRSSAWIDPSDFTNLTGLPKDFRQELAKKNDAGVTFSKIADLIEDKMDSIDFNWRYKL